MALKWYLRKKKGRTPFSRPKIFNLREQSHQNSLEKLFQQNKIQKVIDEYTLQEEEYFATTNPTFVYQKDFKKYFLQYLAQLKKEAPLWQHGRWVYYPWNLTLVHILEEDAFFQVRTARNKNLITTKEQEKFYNSTIGIIGLSIGNSIALTITLQGGAKRIRLADTDHFALSNLNRIRVGVENIGQAKVEVTAREIYTINPYADVELFKQGLTKKNLKKLLHGLDVIIDEMDDFPMKVLIREYAKKYRIPVVMAIDNADSAIIDIERYDKNPNLSFFHGRLGNLEYKDVLDLEKIEIGRLLTKHVGIENISTRMQQSLVEIEKTIISWPQLGGTAFINGAAIAFCIRRILNQQPIIRNRGVVSLDETLLPKRKKSRIKKERQAQSLKQFKRAFGI